VARLPEGRAALDLPEPEVNQSMSEGAVGSGEPATVPGHDASWVLNVDFRAELTRDFH